MSLNRSFYKVPRPNQAPGKGSFWRIADDRTRLMDYQRNQQQNGMRRHSVSALGQGRSFIDLRPRSGSHGQGHLPLLKPRLQYESSYGYAPTYPPSWTNNIQMQPVPNYYLPYPFNVDASMYSGLVQTPDPLDLTRSMVPDHPNFNQNTLYYDRSNHQQGDLSVARNFQDTIGFFNDVWLGSTESKQQTIGPSISPGDFLNFSPVNMISGEKRTPPFQIFDPSL